MLIGCVVYFLTCALYFDTSCGITFPCDQTYLAKTGYWCYPCSAGYSKISECVVNGTQDRCARCKEGKYQPNCDNSTRCAHCKPFCQPGQVKIKSCTATSDIVCQCRAGYYWKPHTGKPDEGYCKAHSKCGAREGFDKKGTPYEDTKCVPCRKGVSYSDNVSFDTCVPCTVCNTTIIAECTTTSNTVCGDHVPQRPTQNPTARDSSAGLDDGVIVAIVIAAILVPALALALFICRYKRNRASNGDTEQGKIDLSYTSTSGGNGLANGHNATVHGVVVSGKETKGKHLSDQNTSANDAPTDYNDGTDDWGDGSLTSNPSSKQSFKHVIENKACDLQRCTDLNMKNETEKDNVSDHNQSKLQVVTSVSGRENLKQEYANKQIQPMDKQPTDITETSDMESVPKNTENVSARTGDHTTLPTALANNINTPCERKLASGCEAIECDALSNSNSENTLISTDAAAVSPRSYPQSGVINMQSKNHTSPREGVTEESTIGGYESVAGNQTGDFSYANQPDEACENAIIGTGAPIFSTMLWFETFAFFSKNMKWGDFLIFIRRLAARTNVKLLERIDVELEHTKEENQSCEGTIHDVMKTWRQETPKATIQDVLDALKECTLNLTYEHLKDVLIKQGLFPVYNIRQNQETAGRFCSELAASNDSEIGHQMKKLKAHDTEIVR